MPSTDHRSDVVLVLADIAFHEINRFAPSSYSSSRRGKEARLGRIRTRADEGIGFLPRDAMR